MLGAAQALGTMKRPACEVLATLTLLLRGGEGALCLAAETEAAPPVLLTNAAQVHALSPETASQRLPARLNGVITLYQRQGNALFLQDETDGIYIQRFGPAPELQVGDRVVMEGESGAGDYAPVMRLRRVEKLGRSELPKPEVVTAMMLATGRYDSRRVEVRGIVRSAALASPTGNTHLAVQLRSEGKDLLLVVNEYQAASTNLVDAEVVVRGVAAGIFSWQRQLLEPTVVVASDADIEVIRPPPQLEELPQKTIQSLFRFSPGGFPEHRVRVRGQLLGRQTAKWLAVRDATSGLFVDSPGAENLAEGDEVELIGFPEMREQTLWLVKPVVRRLGSGPPAAPVVSSVTNALRHPYELHRIEGTLTSPPRPGEGSWVLSLRERERAFEAWLPTAGGLFPQDWREGARLAVTGITEPFFLPWYREVMYPFPTGLRLHARTVADVQLVRSAPWWTSPRLTKSVLIGLAGALLLLSLTTLVAAVLARKNTALREAREQLRSARDELAKRYSVRTGEWQEELAARHAAEADFALLTAERTRMARELHDTLEQTIASVALQLDAAKGFFLGQPEESQRLLETATQQLRESQSEVRRSVWNLRSVKLEEATLPEALQQLGKALADTHGPKVEVQCEGEPMHLPPGVASHLFRIAQEGVTNALKHAQARRIEILLKFKPDGVELCVNDDGCGFDPSATAANGHFGLRGLKERARALEAQLMLDSKPGKGTRVRVMTPATVLRET
jgi:signal transduction histidine kinase